MAASDFVLFSYNAFNEQIAGQPSRLLDHVQDFRRAGAVIPLSPPSAPQSFISQTFQGNSMDSVASQFAASIGISGSYGPFSASVQASTSSSSSRKDTSYFFSYTADVDMGSVNYTGPVDSDVLLLLDEKCVDKLKAISSLKDAAEFTRIYGTHVITGVNLGGTLSVLVTATTEDVETQSKMSLDVSSSYGAISSVKAVASVSQALQTNYSSSHLSNSISAIGGQAGAAARIDPTDPNTFALWAESCTQETVRGLNQTAEYWTLLDPCVARDWLHKFVQYTCLAQSVSNPTIFLNSVAVIAYQANFVDASPSAGYRIIGGGARVTQGSNCFLNACVPTIDSKKHLVSWRAGCHDLREPAVATDTLTSYAICVYDPDNLLTINVGTGIPTAGVLPVGIPAATMVGGGAKPDGSPASQGAFMVTSYGGFQDGAAEWVSFYKVFGTAFYLPIMFYVISIQHPVLVFAIDATYEKGPAVGPSSIYAVSPGTIAGGGAALAQYTDNFLQGSYPSDRHTWTVYNKDQDVPAPVAPMVYAQSLTATFEGSFNKLLHSRHRQD